VLGIYSDSVRRRFSVSKVNAWMILWCIRLLDSGFTLEDSDMRVSMFVSRQYAVVHIGEFEDITIAEWVEIRRSGESWEDQGRICNV
jgi:hypothetical protein